MTYRNPDYISAEKKVEAATLYAVLGDITKVAETTKLPIKVVRELATQTFWEEIQKQVASEASKKFLTKIDSILEQSLEMLEDRIINGDCEYTPARIGRNGDLICEEAMHRVPIKGRDLSQIFHALTGQKNLMDGRATSIVQNSTTEEKLKLLQDHFKKFAQLTVIEGTATEIPEETDGKA